jgi:Subtilase family
MTQTNFLIGRGELLTFDIKAPKRGGEKAELYSFDEAKSRMVPQISNASAILDELPSEACPRDFAVARLTLNPSYIAKSYFPKNLLRSVGLESIGSRTVEIIPERWSKKDAPLKCTTTELFVAGKRNSFRRMAQWVNQVEQGSDEALDLAHIEKFSGLSSSDRIRDNDKRSERFFEVGIHLLPDEDNAFIRDGFEGYANKNHLIVHRSLSFQAGTLWFVPVEGERDNVIKLADFSFVRIIRPVPQFRGLRPMQRAKEVSVKCQLPDAQPLSAIPKVAILDGGLPKDHPIEQWVHSYKVLDPNALDDPDGLDHGLAVTSAFLFGPIQPDNVAQRPFSYVDHIRVLDNDADTEDPLELYRTLGLIEQVLLSRQYEFINLSLGPDLPVEDTDVHAWTSVIDDLLSDGETFMSIAIGNNGERDRQSGNARIQMPADSVNAVAVGAATTTESSWVRASYSAFGPGRSPGIVKPDLMAFGGDALHYFHVLSAEKKPSLVPQLGTSFASPYLLRSAVGIRAILGSELSPLAIKALLVHGADHANQNKLEVGWGKIPENLMDIITCPSGVARVVYQGELKPGKYLRAPLPIPKDGLIGRIRLKATFSYASPVDPQDASAYTRAGLDIVFRPNASRIKDKKSQAQSKGFFDMKKYATEEERRADMGKWETVLHQEKSMLGSSLNAPVFDIHYNARESGAATTRADKIKYALVITVEAPKHEDLYNEILRSYQSILMPIQPQVSLPIRV